MLGSELHLMHPSGARVVLIGTRHVSSLDGDLAASAVAWYRPQTVVLEVDEERYQQLYFRIAHLLDHDSATLMTITAGLDNDATAAGSPASSRQQQHSQSSNQSSGSLQQLLPDALFWRHHHRQFQLMRNEGVPLLLGSMYGADILAAALAGSAQVTGSAAPGTAAARPAVQIVLADQPQAVTMQRLRALTDAVGQVKELVLSLLSERADAEANLIDSLPSPRPASHDNDNRSSETLNQDAFCNSSNSGSIDNTPDKGKSSSTMSKSSDSSSDSGDSISGVKPASMWHKSVAPIFAAAVQLAAVRLAHLCLQWWVMALSSRAQWYGLHLHPVFWLADNQQMQQDLEAAGVQGVKEAAAAVSCLLQCAAHTSSNGEDPCSPAAEDIAAVRSCVESMERTGYARCSAEPRDSGLGAAGSIIAGNARCLSSSKGSGGDNHSFLRPWWVSWQDHIPSLQHVNDSHAAAYEQAVMSERNRLLVEAMWQHAEAAPPDPIVSTDEHLNYNNDNKNNKNNVASSLGNLLWGGTTRAGTASGRGTVTIVGVVGINHLSGMEREWRRREARQSQHSTSDSALPNKRCTNHTTDHYCPACHGSAVASVINTDCSTGTNVHNSAAGEHTHHLPDSFVDYSHSGLVAMDLLADTLEFCVVGAMGLGYWWGVQHYVTHNARPSNTSFSSHGARPFCSLFRQSKLVGFMLLPVAAALIPLQSDASRFQEASDFLIGAAVANDHMMNDGCYGASTSTLQNLVDSQNKPASKLPIRLG